MYSSHKAEKDAETAEAKHNQGKLDLPEKQAEFQSKMIWHFDDIDVERFWESFKTAIE